MQFRGIDLPHDLVRAHCDGDLVLFVGAGASRAAPANLPDFRELAASIVKDAHVEVPDLATALEQPDTLLGHLVDRNVEVNRLVADRLNPPSSKPNALHHAIVKLAAASPSIRIVTTNYDRHLSTVLHQAAVEVEEFVAPALPMGDDFEGLVYLHGSLSQKPRHLIVTDRDFGRAYLRDAWAARFLERMYSRFTVLFIGYSHGDIVLRYLARSLPSAARRYAMTHEPGGSDWRPLGLRPIGYELVDGEHTQLPDSISRWAERASMGLLEHRQRVRELLAAAPSGIPDEMSYLEETVADAHRVRLFTEFARDETWLHWIAQRPVFQRLFEPAATSDDVSDELARWFAQQFVASEAYTQVALQVVSESGGRLGLPLWSALGHRLHIIGEPRPTWLSPWVVLLVEQASDIPQDWLDLALVNSHWPEHRTEALLLFDRLTEPRAVLSGWTSSAPFDVHIRGHSYWLRKAWEKVIEPNLAHAASEILAIADRHLRRAHQLQASAGTDAATFDSVSFRRSAISFHAQDDIEGPLDVLIDAARDSLEAALNEGETPGAGYLQSWADSDVSLLERLAIHGWTHRTDVTAEAKIDWLLERGWLFESGLRTEVFRLLEVALPELENDAIADRLVATASAGPAKDLEPRTHAYERFNALGWIVRHAPELNGASAALAQLEEEHPDFEEREHPERTWYVETGFVQPRPPMPVDEFHRLVTADPSAAIRQLRQYEGASWSLEGSSWSDALALVVENVQQHPSDGLRLLDATDELPKDLIRSVVRGWSGAELVSDDVDVVLTRLQTLDLQVIAEDLSELLAYGGRGETHPTEWLRSPIARELARALWEPLDDGLKPEDGKDVDWLGRAINHPAGRLAQFWLHTIASDWRDADDAWDGLDDTIATELERMLDGHDLRNALAQPVVASQLRFLYGADSGLS